MIVNYIMKDPNEKIVCCFIFVYFTQLPVAYINNCLSTTLTKIAINSREYCQKMFYKKENILNKNSKNTNI